MTILVREDRVFALFDMGGPPLCQHMQLNITKFKAVVARSAKTVVSTGATISKYIHLDLPILQVTFLLLPMN